MSSGWVALLRGINVGGRSTVPMAGLRRLFEGSPEEAAAMIRWIGRYTPEELLTFAVNVRRSTTYKATEANAVLIGLSD